MLQAPVVCMDFGRHSCIVVRATDKKVFYIAMQSDGLVLANAGAESFLKDWKPSDYDVAKAAEFYLGSGANIPIEPSAKTQLEALKSYVKTGVPACSAVEDADPIAEHKEHNTMATAKKAAAPKAKPKAAPKAKPAAKPKAEKKESTRKPGVGSLIQEALLKGKDTATILMDISEKFPDSTAVASTVSWYRTKLRKEGKL